MCNTEEINMNTNELIRMGFEESESANDLLEDMCECCNEAVQTQRALSNEAIRAEANLGLQLESFVSAWSSLAKDCRNKTEWNNFAKYVLNEIEAIDKTIKEVKK